ncbi:hypothetical protein KP509_17G075900 [Ceratopteris richardii]|uniref:Uncharacterized protein n=1 Tax=Ceratopteris richardii TaxID=49495 RepID=A0A8T2SWY0_CERRI|nr:hypothetical protein KP509_17G075900 [Ceratopteris richardii]
MNDFDAGYGYGGYEHRGYDHGGYGLVVAGDPKCKISMLGMVAMDTVGMCTAAMDMVVMAMVATVTVAVGRPRKTISIPDMVAMDTVATATGVMVTVDTGTVVVGKQK